MNIYRTAEVAAAIGIHPNTVRLYEKLGLIPSPERAANGYRIFTDFHIQQLLLARTAFQIEVLQSGLRKKMVSVVKLSANKKFDEAISLTQEYLDGVRTERHCAEEAIQIVQNLLSGETEAHRFSMKRKEVSEYLGISMDSTVFGLLGANGAGKSTTIECMLGTKKPDSGEVSILALDPRKDRRRLFQKVGVQFQQCDYQPEIKVSELCEETACLHQAPADWKKLCAQFGLADKTNSAVKSLSGGGERQRLFIVLALIPDPQVVFLDELTTGLDTKARRDVWKTLEGLKNQGMTIFLTSHFMDEVEALCDEICILKKGRTAFCGTVTEAIEKSGCEKLEDAYLAFAGEEVDAK